MFLWRQFGETTECIMAHWWMRRGSGNLFRSRLQLVIFMLVVFVVNEVLVVVALMVWFVMFYFTSAISGSLVMTLIWEDVSFV